MRNGRINPDDSLWRIWPYIGALIVSLLVGFAGRPGGAALVPDRMAAKIRSGTK